jgi:hypothetical protein
MPADATNYVYRFSLAARTWARLNTTGEPPQERFGAGAAYCGGGLYVHGGAGPTGTRARACWLTSSRTDAETP